MKLCADILYWRLKEKLTTVTQRGKGGSALTLNRPEFYLDRSQSFEKDWVYVCSADHLPQSPKLGENVCLICLGQHWNLSAYYDRCSVILVEGNWDIFRVFNLVQEIFNPVRQLGRSALDDPAPRRESPADAGGQQRDF